MARIKFFINRREPGMIDLAERMRQVGIDFSSIPTTGPVVLWIDDCTNYGSTAVKYAIHKLIEEKEDVH